MDRHVEAGRGDDIALIYDSPVTSTVRKFSFSELQDLTAKFAGVLKTKGVEKGDRVIIYMPMIPETVVACWLGPNWCDSWRGIRRLCF
ncbi:MAG: hypothetical protein CM1200mP40_13400 [Gammaproteobacteria bacterium]|nr:MAG: hypothetical protein CM1200mP40_13400 [Gammaproteobacteria bacterium]